MSDSDPLSSLSSLSEPDSDLELEPASSVPAIPASKSAKAHGRDKSKPAKGRLVQTKLTIQPRSQPGSRATSRSKSQTSNRGSGRKKPPPKSAAVALSSEAELSDVPSSTGEVVKRGGAGSLSSKKGRPQEPEQDEDGGEDDDEDDSRGQRADEDGDEDDDDGTEETERESNVDEDDKYSSSGTESEAGDDVLADNPDIAFIAMFRSRFNDAFPSKLMHFGPQDIERGVVDSSPSPQVEHLLCAILSLLLNRKKPIEKQHYNRALEEAVSAHKHEWPMSWNGVNPIAGTRTFHTIGPRERLSVMKTLILWSLHASESISTIIKQSYKKSRHNDDRNQALSVQPWGRDGDKSRYWLIEGRDDTPFRLYKETMSYTRKRKWKSVAGSLSELRETGERLSNEESQASRRLGSQITSSMTRFEATEEKRKRREYRVARKAQLARPSSLDYFYSGPRTRGRRVNYAFGETDTDGDFDDPDSGLSTPTADSMIPLRRSTRAAAIASGNATVSHLLQAATKAAATTATGPSTTGSGRVVRTRAIDADGNTSWVSRGATVESEAVAGRRRRMRDMAEEEQVGVEDVADDDIGDDDAEDDDLIEDADANLSTGGPQSLVVKLRVKAGLLPDETVDPNSTSLGDDRMEVDDDTAAPVDSPSQTRVGSNSDAEPSTDLQPVPEPASNQINEKVLDEPTKDSTDPVLHLPIPVQSQEQGSKLNGNQKITSPGLSPDTNKPSTTDVLIDVGVTTEVATESSDIGSTLVVLPTPKSIASTEPEPVHQLPSIQPPTIPTLDPHESSIKTVAETTTREKSSGITSEDDRAVEAVRDAMQDVEVGTDPEPTS